MKRTYNSYSCKGGKLYDYIKVYVWQQWTPLKTFSLFSDEKVFMKQV